MELDRNYMENLLKIISDLGLKRELAREYSQLFNAKEQSIYRQLNRILAFIEEREVQSRSGRRNMDKWIKSAEEVLKRRGMEPDVFKPKVEKEKLPEDMQKGIRSVFFSNPTDAYNYRLPIPKTVSFITYNKDKQLYEVEIFPSTEYYVDKGD